MKEFNFSENFDFLADINSFDDFIDLRDYYNDIRIYNSDDIENERHTNLLVEICDYVEYLQDDMKTFDKLVDILSNSLHADKRHLNYQTYHILLHLLYHLYNLQMLIELVNNDIDVGTIFRD